MLSHLSSTPDIFCADTEAEVPAGLAYGTRAIFLIASEASGRDCSETLRTRE